MCLSVIIICAPGAQFVKNSIFIPFRVIIPEQIVIRCSEDRKASCGRSPALYQNLIHVRILRTRHPSPLISWCPLVVTGRLTDPNRFLAGAAVLVRHELLLDSLKYPEMFETPGYYGESEFKGLGSFGIAPRNEYLYPYDHKTLSSGNEPDINKESIFGLYAKPRVGMVNS